MNMAASSSSSSSAPKEYDVFISFRGEDTRYNFTSHLASALSRNSIRAYVDYELKKGDEISSSLIKAIHDSYGSLIVFSENYASSKWCLNELVQILKCRKKGHFVIPVFYNTDPSCVRKQTASYGEAFEIHAQNSRNKEKLESWKAALTEAANIVGWDTQSPTNRDESELIKNIVNDILQKMDHIYQPSQSNFVGIDKYCEEIEFLLQRSPVVGIWGIGGVGKTTIARFIFDKLFSQYDSSCFFENVREESKRNGPNYIRNKLLSELLKDKNFLCGTTKSPALNFAMRRLSNKRILIVLDDVNSFKQLEYLQEEYKRLRADSRVIITTRDKHLLNGFRNCHEIYEVQGLNFGESLHLFRLNAFNENNSEIGYEEITKKFVDYASGNPLALKVLGSFLFSKSKEEWESALAKLNKIPNPEIQQVLRLSYDGLDHYEQQIFLDIACCLRGDHIEDVKCLLDSFGFFGPIGMSNLQNKALVTILSNKRVHMHDLLQEMGRNIVRTESIKYPGSRSRLWDPEEVYDVLTNDKGTDAIEGIMLDLSKINDLSLKSDTFKKMTNLRFVKFYSSNKSCKVDLLGSFVLPLEKLRYIRWDGYPWPSLPRNFCAKEVVMLCLSESNITKLWDGLQDMVHLKKINLSKCIELMELPDFSNASKLEHVDLSYCSNLPEIHPSLLHLDTLAVLNVRQCKKIMILKSERYLRSLYNVLIDGCSSLKKISLSTEKIEELCFDGTAIETLPSSLDRCKNLTKLKFGELLAEIPSEIYILSSLKSLCIRGSRVNELPETIKHLLCLQHLDVTNCQWLRSLPELPPSVKILLAKNCSILETLILLLELETCDLGNCVNLDEQSFSRITAYAHYRVKQVKTTRLCLPGDRVLRWFTYRSRQTTISIELPPHSYLLGFVCYLKVRSTESFILCMGCKCYSEYSDTGKLKIGECCAEFDNAHTRPNSSDVDMWIHKFDSYSALERRRAYGLFSFEFFTNTLFRIDSNNNIEECGVWPIYTLELESGDNSSNGNRCELESLEHQQIKVGGFQHEGQPQKLLGEFTIQSDQLISKAFDSVKGDGSSGKLIPMKVAIIQGCANSGATILELRGKLMDQVEWLPVSIGKLSHVSELDLSENRIMALPPTTGGLKALTKLDLHSNQLINLPNSFGELINLTDLDLHANRLKSLPESFGNLKNLLDLDLSSNEFTLLPEIIGDLTSLKRFIAEENELEELPYTIGNCISLSELRLGFNQIKALPERIGDLTSLKRFIVEENELEELPYTIGNCISLSELRLGFNQIKAFPEGIGKLERLEILTVQYNRIKKLPTTTGNLSHLKELDVSFNELEFVPQNLCFAVSLKKLNVRKNFADLRALPVSIGKLSDVSELDLSENRIMALPPTIGGLKALTKLDLHSNQLINLPNSFGELINLTDLDLHANRLKSLPESFGNLTNLLDLDLSSNEFTLLPEITGDLTSLKRFIVQRNELEELPYTIGNCISLSELRLDFNQIKALPEGIGKLERLEILTVLCNRIKKLPTTMGNLSHLKELDVSFNELEFVPESLCFAVSLKKLNVGKNFADLRGLPRSIGNLEMLEELDISDNQIKALPESFRFLSKLRVFRADETPLELPPREIVKLGAQATVQYMADFVAKQGFVLPVKKKTELWLWFCSIFSSTRR